LSSCGGGERGCFVRGWWPIPISALAVRRGRSDRGCRGSFQPGTGGCALSVRSRSARQVCPCGGASMSRTMLNGSLVRSGRLRLEFAHHVVSATADLARNGEHSAFADARGSLCMQSAVGAVGTLRMLGCFDQSPAQRRRAVLGEMAAAPRLAGLVDDRIEAGGADRLPRAPESRCFAPRRD
jgi:hypothetical protein